MADGPVVAWTAPEGAVSVEQGWACEGFGRRRPRPVLCWRGTAGRGRPLPFTLTRLR